MRRAAHILLIAWICAWSGVAPLWGGMVVCEGRNGHVELEQAHPFSGCPSAPAGHGQDGDESKGGCVDTRLASDDMTRPQRDVNFTGVHLPQPFDLPGTFAADLTGHTSLTFARTLAFDSPPSLLDASLRLSSVVLQT